MVAWSHLVYTSIVSEKFAVLQIASKSVTHTSIIGSSTVALLGPVAGLVASDHYGRYRTLYSSFWFMWSGTLATAFLLVMDGVLLEAHQT